MTANEKAIKTVNKISQESLAKIDATPDADVSPVTIDDINEMGPEVFNDLLDSLQEIEDINSGKIDASEYDVQTIHVNDKPKKEK